MSWVLLIVSGFVGWVLYRQQARHHADLVARIEDIDTEVETLLADRRRLQEFIRRRVTERVADFKMGGGRERLRERLRQKAAAVARRDAGPAHGVPTSPAQE